MGKFMLPVPASMLGLWLGSVGFETVRPPPANPELVSCAGGKFVAVSGGSHSRIFDRSGMVVETLRSSAALRVTAGARDCGLF